MQKVNLDALIPREDFEIKESPYQSSQTQTIQVRDLEQGSFFYGNIRKPDFQRETSEWDDKKIIEFVTSFLDGDLIPAIILWNSGSYVFAIDGAHRLSALIAWVNDDYGDGVVSKSFYNHNIPDEQFEIATKIRKKVNKELGSYKDHQNATQNPTTTTDKIRERAQRLASLAIQLQWVTGNAEKAESSFFKINQNGAAINDTELRLLKSRKKPNAIAARAIIRAGSGHKYWSKYEDKVIVEIESLAKEIFRLLFNPDFQTPIKTLDLPLAGKRNSQQTLSLIIELVDASNELDKPDSIEEDNDGASTIQFMKKTKKVLSRLTGQHASSLGLHPVVYFYSSAGRYQVTPFLAFIEIIKKMEKEKKFPFFIKIRRQFEDYLLSHKVFVKQVAYKYGSGTKSAKILSELFIEIMELLEEGLSDEQLTNQLISEDSKFNYLNPTQPDLPARKRSDFDSNTKSATFLSDALQNPVRCKICDGLIHRNSISIDHKTRKEDGGYGNLDNAQVTHPYCNTTIKN